MKQSIKFLLVLLAFSFLLSCARTPLQAISEKPIALIENLTPEKIRNSIVLIESETESGSGFFVTRDKIATNSHVVAHPGPIHVKSPDEGTVWTIEGVTGFDAANNIVILKLTSEGMPLPLGGSDTARIGEPVSIPGYPDGEYIVTEGSIQSIRNSNKWLRVNTTTSKETNGSPVLNNKGEVIAVIVPYDNGSYSYAIPSSALNALLDRSLPIEPLSEWQQQKHVRAQAYYSLGVERLDSEDYAEAIVNFDKALELTPGYVRAHYMRGMAQFDLGDHASGIATLTQTLTIDSADPDLYYSLGSVKANLGDYDDAMVDLDKAIDLDAQHANAYNNLAGVKFSLGEAEEARGNIEEARDLYQAAITDCDKAIQIDPEDAYAYINRGNAKSAHGDLEGVRGNTKEARDLYQAAIVDYDKAIQIDPEGAYAYINRGSAKSAHGDLEGVRGNTKEARDLYQAAIVDYDKAIQIDPEGADTYSNRGNAKLSLAEEARGNVEEAQELYQAAITDYDTAIQIDPENAAVYSNRGSAKLRIAQAARGNVEEARDLYQAAITDYDTVIQIDPEDADTYSNRGNAKFSLAEAEAARGNVEEAQELYQAAITDYDTVIQIEPENAAVYSNRGNAKLRFAQAARGNVEEAQELYQAAITDYDTAIQIDPEDANAYINRGNAKFGLGDLEAARGNVEEAQELYQAAITDYDTVIQIEPENAAVYSNRGNAKFGLAEATHGYSAERQGSLIDLLLNSEDADTDSNPELEELRLREVEAEGVNLYEAAIADYDTAIQINPENTEVYNYRGYARFHLGTFLYSRRHVEKVKELYKAAIEDYTRVIRVNPEDAIYFRRGIVKCKLGDIESEFGDAEIVQRLYHEGIIDYDRSTQLNNPEDAYAETTDLLSKKVTNSIIRVVNWDGDNFSNGSGFFVEKDKIATNIHVVAVTGSVFVTLRNEETIWKVEEVSAFDAENDLVILKVAREGIPLSLGDSDMLQSGEPVVAVGYPGGGYKVTAGVIDRNDGKSIRMKVGTSGGSSGGPALNSEEQVIGIHVGGDEYYAYSIPSNTLKALIALPRSTEPLVEWRKRGNISAYASFTLGLREFKSNRYHEAVIYFSASIVNNLFSESIGSDLMFGDAYSWRGIAHANLGNYDQAIADYNTAIQFNPDNAKTYTNRGQVRFYLGESESSRGNAEKAEKLYEAAVADCTQTVKLYPEYAEAYYWRGRAKEALREKEAAAADFEQAKALNPKVGQDNRR